MFFASSALIVALNFPLIARDWLFRFQPMNSILIPLITPAAALEVRSKEAKATTRPSRWVSRLR